VLHVERLDYIALPPGLAEDCHVYYTTNCETKFQEKEVEEELPICNEVVDNRCNNDGENCMEIMKRVSFCSIIFNFSIDATGW
jgi:hypothetical protein